MPRFSAVIPEQFASKSWLRSTSYSFAANINIIPLVGAELSKSVPAFPMGFVEKDGIFQLVAVMALRPEENLLVTPDGRWLGDYVPALIRSYPFRLGAVDGLEKSVLCFDEDSGLLAEAGIGVAFFDEAGALSPSLKDVLDFVAGIESSRIGLQVGVDALAAANMMQPWPLITDINGRNTTVNGLYQIDETVLNQLDAETLHDLRNKGALAIAYAQLFSMNQLSVLEKLKPMREQLQAQAQAAQQAANANDLNLEFLNNSGTISFGNLQ